MSLFPIRFMMKSCLLVLMRQVICKKNVFSREDAYVELEQNKRN